MSAEAASIDQLIAYCASLAEEFNARRNRVRTFISNHNLTSGTANEAILRNFLASIASRNFSVTEGFICDPFNFNKSRVSRQCDILVHDTRFPLVYSEAGVTIVWPEAAQMVIEVKTDMNAAHLESAVNNIVSAKQTEDVRRLIGVIFAFKSLKGETVLKQLREYRSERPDRPVAIILFDEGWIIQQSDLASALKNGGGDSEYELRKLRDDSGFSGSSLALTYLLLLFLHPQFSHARAVSFGDIVDALRTFLRDYTHLV